MAIMWIAVPVGVAVFAVQRGTSRAEPEVRTVWARATQAEATAEEPAVLLLHWRARPPVVAPAWAGLVEEVLVRPDDELATGVPVVQVDRIKRIAVASDVPFSRALKLDDRGRDVAALNEVLPQLGYEANVGDTFGPTTRRGVTALARALGAGDQEQFDPAWFLYLPVQRASIAEVDLQVAAPAAAAGQPIAHLSSPIAVERYAGVVGWRTPARRSRPRTGPRGTDRRWRGVRGRSGWPDAVTGLGAGSGGGCSLT
jgi:hypothetical protein